VLYRDDAPELFTDIPDEYTVLIRRHAAELAALRYTGHKIKEHRATKDKEFPSMLNDLGYFVAIEGLGDLASEELLKTIEANANGFLLQGEIRAVMDDTDEHPSTFSLSLSQGEVEGTWRRQYEEK
ncbi:MAG: hypothetical protein IJS50_03930, partial [Desulfovibrio sp.]|nr:hypothetical protein [Desulfovibrio sp.]